MDLAAKAVLVTGGKRMGAAVATECAARGADVAVVYHRSAAEAQRVVAEVERHGRRAFALQADLSDPAACQSVVDRAAEHLGRLDCLVNMASVYTPVTFADTDLSVFEATLHVDLRASFLCARAAVPHMRRAGAGRIVNFADWIAASGRPRYKGFLPYYVAKRAVMGLTEALALELASEGILVNAVAPGPVEPPEGMTEEEQRAVEVATPVGRWGGAAEIARAVVYLMESEFVTGETLRVDGGRHIK